MEENKKEALRKMQENHLSVLMQFGVHFTGLVSSASAILEDEYLGETELSDDEKRKLFEILTTAARKHSDLIQQIIEEGQNFINSMQSDDQSAKDTST